MADSTGTTSSPGAPPRGKHYRAGCAFRFEGEGAPLARSAPWITVAPDLPAGDAGGPPSAFGSPSSLDPEA
ncbi:MAG: hypothetical protein ACI8U3_002553 [Brevundimonas sp.]|jgi:hypothetical protein